MLTKVSVGPPKVLPDNIDPISISCYLHSNDSVSVKYALRAKLGLGHGFRVDFESALPMVTDKHKEEAKIIRDHFAHKLLMVELTNSPEKHSSKYRKTMLRFLSRNDNAYSEDEIGMLLSLPRLYEEDQITDNLKANYNNSDWTPRDHQNVTIETTMTYIASHTKKSFRHSRSLKDRMGITKPSEWICYWMSDCNDRIYMVEMDFDCPFRNYWESVIEHPFEVQGSPIQNSGRGGLNYYTFREWQIL